MAVYAAVIVISPHLDDAVFSVGQVIAGAIEPAKILTVFAGVPDEDVSTPYDESAGFASAREAMRVRIAEDVAACEALGDVTWSHVDMLDSQYRHRPPNYDELRRRFSNAPDETILFPLGLSHPDHEVVHAACLDEIETWRSTSVWVYEELPYRVHFPELVHAQLRRLEDAGFNPLLQDLPQASVDVKREAVECYQSQLNEMMRRCVYVPERTWRIR